MAGTDIGEFLIKISYLVKKIIGQFFISRLISAEGIAGCYF
jgi:hypothetical protein